ncbi:hypothetical protein [Micromonospora tarapacensis]|uniref:hypothetical protein n=1 Tax=Micromonospora tarapacensis TaxID=2835305 RepID=UPI0038B2FDCB
MRPGWPADPPGRAGVRPAYGRPDRGSRHHRRCRRAPARPDASDAEIEDAARAARIHDLIAGLPDGYDTMVGSRGHRFSGGGPSHVRDPRILVLDEATSAIVEAGDHHSLLDRYAALAT